MTNNSRQPKEANVIDSHAHDLLLDALAVLEAIAEEGVTFATEQAAERVILRIKARVS